MKKCVFFLLLHVSFYLPSQTVINGDFESGSTGWVGHCPCSSGGNCIELNPETVYGGTVSSNTVAEIDGHNNSGTTADDRVLCQSIDCFVIGRDYTLTFDASRRTTGPTPNTVEIIVEIDGGVLTELISRSGPFVWITESFTFTATQNTHLLTFKPNFSGSHGMLVNDVEIHPDVPISITPAGPFCATDPSIQLQANPPGGTWSGTGVNSTGLFNPSTAGQGNHTITYTLNNGPGCPPEEETINITVNLGASINPIDPVCDNDLPFNATGNPSGGSWSGAVTGPNGQIDPSILQAGTHSVTYTITSPCVSSDTETFTITAAPNPVITPITPVCENVAAFNLSATPANGIWGGAISSSLFNPASLGSGIHPVSYEVTSGNCTGIDMIDIEVLAAPDPQITPPGQICDGDGIITLSATPPFIGTWGGVANSLGEIDPDFLGAGTFNVTYEVTNSDNCTEIADLDFVITPLPIVFIDPIAPICETDDPITLIHGPFGGTWTGDVDGSGGIDPANLGEGIFTGNYEVTSGGCTKDSTITFEVLPGPDISIDQIPDICQNGGLFEVFADPPNGTWGGVADALGMVDPSILSSGFHEVTYTATSPDGCEDTQSEFFEVFEEPSIVFLNTGPFCLENIIHTIDANPFGGTFSGDVDFDGSFNPINLGAGTFKAVYSYDSGDCETADSIMFTILPADQINFLSDSVFCQNSGIVSLLATPSGGSWTGTNIGSTGQLNTNGLAIGTYPMTYTTSSANNCVASKIMNVVILGIEADIDGPDEFCQSDGIQTFFGDPTNGTWGGVADAFGMVDPSTLAAGVHEVTYTVTSSDGCQDTDMETFRILEIPDVFFFNTGPFCLEDQLHFIDVDPYGGFWSGDVDFDGSFNPINLGVGTFTAVYFYDLECEATDSVMFSIISSGVVTFGDSIFCQNTGLVTLSADPSGGTWSGSNVNSSGEFNTDGLAVGIYPVTYTISAGGNCTTTKTLNIEIRGIEAVITGQDQFCQTDGIQSFSGNPINGTWGGVSDASGMVDPSTLSAGAHDLTYTATSADGCEDTATKTITILAAPPINFSNTGPFCLGDQIQTIRANPTGGTWSGDVDINGSFNSIDLGAGTFKAVYFNNSGNCDALDSVFFSIISPDAVTFGDSIFCENSGLQILIATPSGGMWSGTNVSPTGELNTDGLAIGTYPITYTISAGTNCTSTKMINIEIRGIEATINGPDNFCQTADIQNYIGNPINGTWGGAANMAGEVNPTTLTIGNHDITYSITSTDGCMDTATFPIEITNPPTATLTGTGTICSTGNTTTDLTINLTGVAPWQVEYTIDGVTQTAVTVNSNPFQFTVSQAGEYLLTGVTDSEGCPNVATGMATVTELTPLVINNLIPVCNNIGTGYTFSFEINGGDPTSYMISGVTGTLTGNTFTSDFLGNLVQANFTVSDNSGCGPVSDMLTLDCACETMVGEMNPNLVDLCEGETAEGIYDSSLEILDSDDILQYVLHTNAGISLGNVIAFNDIPIFDFMAPMQFETTYYISAIAGNNDGSGNVDLTDICTQIAPGTPVIWHETPTATISGMDNICPGGEATLIINFTGTGPWDIQYSDGTTMNDVVGIMNSPFEIKINPQSNTTYQLASVATRFCPGTISGNANITTVTSPTVENIVTECNPDKTAYTITFDIIDGDMPTYNVMGNSGNLSGNTFVSDPITVGDGYSFTVTDGFDCDPFIFSEASIFCNCETEAGTMAGNQQEICIDETIQLSHNLDEFLDANDVLVFVLHDGDANNLGNILMQNVIPEFSFDASILQPGITYYVSAIAGNGPPIDLSDRCLSVSLGIPVIFHELPTVTLDADPAICLGDDATVNLQFTGAAPYFVTFSNGTTLDNINNDFDFQERIIQNTTYSIIKVIDANGCENIGTNDVTIQVNEPPMATVINGAICNIGNNGNVTTLDFSELISSGDPTGIWRDVDGSGATGSFPIIDFSGIIPGAYRFEYTTGAAVTPCQNVSYTISIEVLDCSCPPIATAPAGPFCNDNAILNLDDITLTNEIGIWSITAAPTGSTVNILNNTFDATDQPMGDYELTFTLDQNPGPDCQASSSQTITIFEAVSAGQSPGTLQICNDESILNLFDELVGATPGGTWTDQSINGATGFNDGILNTQNLSPGTYTFTYEVTSNPPCSNDSQEITIEIENTVVAGDLVENLSLCEGDDQTIDLFDLIENNDPDGIWNDLSTNPVNGFNNSTFATNNLSTGTYTFEYLLTTQGICPEDRIEVEVVINPNPIAEAGEADELSCENRIANLGGQSSSGPNIIYQWTGNVDNPNAATTFTNEADTYILLVTDTLSGCNATDEITVTEDGTPPTLNANSIEITCFGDNDGEIKVENVVNGVPPYLYSLNDSALSSDNEFSNLSPGVYVLEVEDAEGCKDTLTFTIDEPMEVTVTLSTSLTNSSNLIQFGDSIQLNANISAPYDSISWSPPEAFDDCDPQLDPNGCENPWVSPEILTTYQVYVVNENGCADRASITIAVKKEFSVFIPSAFSPNDDGINDIFRIYTDKNVEKIKSFLVFDRWGENVFELYDFHPDEPAAGWNGLFRGKKMNSAVFVFYAEIEFKDGSTQLFEGDVSLLK